MTPTGISLKVVRDHLGDLEAVAIELRASASRVASEQAGDDP
ncbi:MAG: hypothetical protein PVG07_05570 [Acidobacteriota bacterium]|jgi:hypothetical protein